MTLWNYTQKRDEEKTGVSDDQVPLSQAWYRDPEFDKLQERLLPEIERLSDLQLFTTYNYWRMYRKGAILKVHKDRPACEISITLSVGYDSAQPWPIFLMDRKENPIKVDLEAGDALLYRGIELSHWRSSFEGEKLAQVFFHFVDKFGPNANQRGDIINRGNRN